MHEKLFSTSKVLEKLSDCICSERIKLLLVQDTEFAAFMSTYPNTHKTLEYDTTGKKMSKIKEDSKVPIRDRHKRPDKQLYVPRALRKTANENIPSEKDNENGQNNQKGETSQRFSRTVMKTDSESLFLKQKENQKEVDKVSSTLSNDIPDVKYNMSPVQKNDVNTTEESILLPIKDTTHFETAVTKQEESTNGDEPCLNATKHEMNIDVEKKPIELNEVTCDNLKKICSTEYSKKENLHLSDVTKQQEICTAYTNHCSESADDSWEAKFNDEGDCLDPKLVKELCDITGRIEMTVAKEDYSDYQPVSTDASKGYDNIVELFGFPVEFSTQDLTSAFSAFQSSSYNIKWVDDCHALAIFSSPVIASQALHLSHPFIKVRPLSEGIKESKEKAKFCTRMFETYKPRPVTSALLARRLVSGALGLKVNASKEQRDMERNILREAREKKKLKAKQRQDIWNGIVS